MIVRPSSTRFETVDPSGSAGGIARRGARSHDGGTQSEQVIFAAAERLLADVPLGKLSVASIIVEAGISRGTYYHYFSSKYGPVVGLTKQVMDEILEVVRPFVDRAPDDNPEDALRKSLSSAVRVWALHRHVIRATTVHWPDVPELRTLWLGSVERFTTRIAAEIDRERVGGIAPPGPDSHQLAATLLWSTEHALYVAGLRTDRNLPDEEQILEPLVTMWVGTIYGRPSWAG